MRREARGVSRLFSTQASGTKRSHAKAQRRKAHGESSSLCDFEPLREPLSAAAGQIEEFAEAFQNANLERDEFGLVEFAAADQILGRAAGFRQFRFVADEVGD